MTMRDKLIMRQTSRKKIKLWSNYCIEQQAQEAYNLKIFMKFQWQLRRATKLQADELEKGKLYKVYTTPDHPFKEFRSRTYIGLWINKIKTSLVSVQSSKKMVCYVAPS